MSNPTAEPTDIEIVIEPPLPEIVVELAEVGLAGRNGRDGRDGIDSDGTIAMDAHVNSPLPHPVYDEGPSFLLLYQNAKV